MTFESKVYLPWKAKDIIKEDPFIIQLEGKLRATVVENPITFVYGAFGSGKTTLVKKVLEDHSYADLNGCISRRDFLSGLGDEEDGGPVILDELSCLHRVAGNENLDIDGVVDYLQDVSAKRRVVLIGPHNMFNGSSNYINQILQHERMQGSYALVPVPTWPDELMKKVVKDGFDLPEDYASDVVDVCIGLPRVFNFLVPSYEEWRSRQEGLPLIDKSGALRYFFEVNTCDVINGMVKGEVSDKEAIVFLKEVGLVKRVDEDPLVIVGEQGYGLRSSYFEYNVKGRLRLSNGPEPESKRILHSPWG